MIMSDEKKTKAELIKELNVMRFKCRDLERELEFRERVREAFDTAVDPTSTTNMTKGIELLGVVYTTLIKQGVARADAMDLTISLFCRVGGIK